MELAGSVEQPLGLVVAMRESLAAQPSLDRATARPGRRAGSAGGLE